jgi:hypothetical protein
LFAPQDQRHPVAEVELLDDMQALGTVAGSYQPDLIVCKARQNKMPVSSKQSSDGRRQDN